MAAGDLISRLLILRQPRKRLPLGHDNSPELLVLRLDGIGDNVCSWPALQLLREQLPESRITLAVGTWAATLYRECPWIDEVIQWDSGLFGLFRGNGPGGLFHDLEMTRRLKKRRFSAGIDLRGDLLSIVLLRLIAPPIRIATVTRGGERLLTDPLASSDGHETQRTWDIACTALGLTTGGVPPLLDWPRPEAMCRAREKLQKNGWDPETLSVALCPQALWPWKQWPKKRFRELAGRLKAELGLQVIWFLEESTVAAEYTSNEPVFCGPLDEVAAVLGLCTLAVSNDSGLMHLAIAAGCPTVQLFGPGDAARFAHHGERVALHHDASCGYYPCTRSGECENKGGVWCLDKITVDAVFSSCCRLLAKGA